MDFQRQLAHTRKYAAAFWEKELVDRPFVAVTAPMKQTNFSYSPAISYRTCMKEDYDSVLDSFQELVDNTYYAGEALPNLELTLGPDQFAAFLGGRIDVSEESYTTWVHPCVDSLADYHAVLDKSPDGYFEKMFRFFQYAKEKAEGHFMLNMLDLHSNMDALSALRGAQNLCLDLIDCPDEVLRVLSEVNAVYPEVFNLAYVTGRMEQVGTIGWSPIYCANKMAMLECDFSCLLSPEQGRRFVFPAIEQEASYLDHNIYHLDGVNALGHIDTILSMDCIDCIQWVPGDTQPRSLEWMDLLHKIQAAGKSVWIWDWSAEEIKAHYQELKPELTAFSLGVNTPYEADDLITYLEKHT